jgi:hypothetical protein
VSSDPASAVQRVVLLGASNLTISFPRIVRRLRSGTTGRLDVFAALGHGRSFGEWSAILCRGLPGIAECGLWERLDELSPGVRPELALVTDVGNDLLYGYDVARITRWVDLCLARLAGRGARLVLTLIPLGSVERLSAWRFLIARTLLFPRNRMSYDHLFGAARDLNGRLAELGRQYGAHVVEPQACWYGVDPIHVRRSCRAEAWECTLGGWNALGPGAPQADEAGLSSWRLRRLRPELRTMCRRVQRTRQPALELPDTSVSLF